MDVTLYIKSYCKQFEEQIGVHYSEPMFPGFAEAC